MLEFSQGNEYYGLNATNDFKKGMMWIQTERNYKRQHVDFFFF